MTGLVKKIIGKNFYCITENDKIISACARGNLKLSNIKKISVGDIVSIDSIDNNYVIEKIYDRKNSIDRPNLVNVDICLLVFSLKEPNFNIDLFFKYLAYYEFKLGSIIIVLSKYDLLNNKEKEDIDKFIAELKLNDYKIYKNTEINELIKEFDNKKICIIGNSGVGKSTLINNISPNLNLRTQEISKALNRGKHTTVNVELIKINNFYLFDTPGFSSLDLELRKNELAISFHDFAKLSLKCQFSNCLHLSETKCEVKKHIGSYIPKIKYDSYIKLLKEK